MAMPAFTAWPGLANFTGAPSITMSPASGAWTPAITLIKVDLPAPFSPTRACTSPGRNSKSTSLSARTPGKLLDAASSWRGLAAPDGAAAGPPGGTPGRPVAPSRLLRKACDILFSYEGNIHDVAL